MSYVIEDGIELPPTKQTGAPRQLPRTELGRAILALEAGQSVRLPEVSDYKAAEQFAARQRPKRFAIRKFNYGWRIWRIE